MTDPIPHWPKRSRGCMPMKEGVATRCLERDMEAYNRASVAIRSWMYNNDQPLVCIQCGALTDSDGAIPCGH